MNMMDVMEAIHARKSVGKFAPRAVEREKIEQLLDAGVQAPNHYKVRPWRFVVLSGKARERLGELMAEIFHRKFPAVDPAALQKERRKPLRSPVIIAVAVDAPSEPKVLEIENICAAAAACENILLAAHAMGLGGYWRTGGAARDPDVKSFLGISREQHLIAFLYIGHAEMDAAPAARPGFEDRTTWMD
jgi:nitroreductase